MSYRDNPPTVIDLSVVEELRSLSTIEDPDVFKEVVELFCKHTQERVALMTQSFSQQDIRKLKMDAHSLKSSSGGVGAIQLMSLCIKIEEMIDSDQVTGLKGLIEQLSREFVTAKTALEDLVKNPQQKAA